MNLKSYIAFLGSVYLSIYATVADLSGLQQEQAQMCSIPCEISTQNQSE